jgi:hypothetical protein
MIPSARHGVKKLSNDAPKTIIVFTILSRCHFSSIMGLMVKNRQGKTLGSSITRNKYKEGQTMAKKTVMFLQI